MQWRALTALAFGIGLAGCAPADTQEATTMAGSMQLTSPAFDAGGRIPEQYGCNGDGVSPPLAWTDVPDGVDGFAILVTDPDAGGFVHWILTGIPGDARELAEGEGDAAGVAGRNGFGNTGWGGPCPPSGEHRYVFELFALSEPLGISGEPSESQVRAAADHRTLAHAELAGTYAR